ncbi:hypothetical protein A3K63_04935 [Candidatus Micrarchaeota archaeon RBG_16_49_10]|nr:MAG: hypothetical protein A3K63_04935 [Candidatus Micrarchaeota archaeon RBG_16_49_10]
MYREASMFKESPPPERYFPYIDKVRRILPAKRYLTMPFPEQPFGVTEGWFYSAEENRIHGMNGHVATDFELPFGTEVLAAAPGWAMASYMRKPLFGRDGLPLTYEGKPITTGYGYFVQVYHPETRRFTIYAHLNEISREIPYSLPYRLEDGGFEPSNLKISSLLPFMVPLLISPKRFRWVERGEMVGRVGDSGNCWGFDDFPARPDRRKYPSWDETHLHLEEIARFPGTGRKILPRDPYDIYGRGDEYPDSFKVEGVRDLGPKASWLLENGLPKFAGASQRSPL